MGYLDNLFKNIKNGIQTVTNGVANTGNVVQNITNGLRDNRGNIVNGVKNAAMGAVDQAGDAVYGAVEKAQGVLSGATDKAREVAGAVSNVGGVVQNVTDKVTDAKDQLSGYGDYLTGAAEQIREATPGAYDASYNAVSGAINNGLGAVKDAIMPNASAPAPTPTPAPEQTPDATPVPRPTPEQTPTPENPGYTSQYAPDEDGKTPVLGYQEFLQGLGAGYDYIKTETSDLYDKQNSEALAALQKQKESADAQAKESYDKVGSALDEQKAAADEHATTQRDTLINMSEAERQSAYAFAESQGIADRELAAQMYQGVVDAIKEEQATGKAMAQEQRDLLLSMSSAERDAAYKYAAEQRANAESYANSQYQTLVDAINAQKTSGAAMAQEQRDLLLNMSEEQRQAVYAAAKRQRQEAHTEADISRERATVDAGSSYAQNLANYGASAEALGRMGIGGGGYSDWVNNNAYATQRAEVQAARAQADAAKRQANYTEDQLKNQADSEYSKAKYNAEQAYSERMYDIDTSYRENLLKAEKDKSDRLYAAGEAEAAAKQAADQAHRQNEYNANAKYTDDMYNIDTSYRTNMLNAEREKLEADHRANATEAERKQEADTAHRQNEYAANSSYSDMIYQNEAAHKAGKLENELGYSENLFKNEAEYLASKLESEQRTEAGKHAANMDYVKNIMQNDERIAQYAEELRAGTEEAAEKRKALLAELVTGASSGAYDADTIKALAGVFGFSDEEIKSAVDGANKYGTEAAEGDRMNKVTTLLGMAKNGELTASEISTLAGEYGLDANDPKDKAMLDMITGAADQSAGVTAADNFASVLGMVNSGQLNGEEAATLAKALGIDGQYGSLIASAAKRRADGTAESEAMAKTDNFVALLGMANSGELNAGELLEVAKQLGFDEKADATSLDLITQAAKRYADGSKEAKAAATNASFISLLDAANSGAYTAAQIPELAKMLGIKDQNLVSMLTQAATDYSKDKSEASAAANTEYMNGVYAELATAARGGSYDAETIRALAGRFGFSNEEIDELAGMATRKADSDKAAADKADSDMKNQNFMNLMAESGDPVGYIESAVAAGAIDKAQGGKYLTSSFKTAIESGEVVDTAAVKNALDKGYIDQPTYNKLSELYSESFDTSTKAFPNSGDASKDFAEATKFMEAVIKDPLLTKETKDALRKSFEGRFAANIAFFTDEEAKLYEEYSTAPTVKDNDGGAVVNTNDRLNANNVLNPGNTGNKTGIDVKDVVENANPTVTYTFYRPNGTPASESEMISWYQRYGSKLTKKQYNEFVLEFKNKFPRSTYFN